MTAAGPVVRVGVAVMIVARDGSMLFGLRKSTHGQGTWGLPGGAIDFGETPVEAARREVMEETGLEVGEILPNAGCPYVNTKFANGSQWVTLYFRAEYRGGDPRVVEPEKCERWEWFGPHAIPEPLFEPLSDNAVLQDNSNMHTPNNKIPIDDLVWLSGLTDEQLADAVIDENGFEGRFIAFPEAVHRRAKSAGSQRASILRTYVRQQLEHWVASLKVICDEHEKLLKGTSL